MDSENDNYEVIYCPEDDEYRVYCNIYDKLCVERYYKIHLKSGNHTKNFYKSFQNNLVIQICVGVVIFVIKLCMKNLEIIIVNPDSINVYLIQLSGNILFLIQNQTKFDDAIREYLRSYYKNLKKFKLYFRWSY